MKNASVAGWSGVPYTTWVRFDGCTGSQASALAAGVVHDRNEFAVTSDALLERIRVTRRTGDR